MATRLCRRCFDCIHWHVTQDCLFDGSLTWGKCYMEPGAVARKDKEACFLGEPRSSFDTCGECPQWVRYFDPPDTLRGVCHMVERGKFERASSDLACEIYRRSMAKTCVDCEFWKRTETGDDPRGWGKCQREEDLYHQIRGDHLGCRHWIRYSWECQGCVYWEWLTPDLRVDRTLGNCKCEDGEWADWTLDKNRRACPRWLCRGCFDPRCDGTINNPLSLYARDLLNAMDAAKAATVEAAVRAAAKAVAREEDKAMLGGPKKKRRWGIYHERYGWLGTGSGGDFVTSSKKEARREAVEWLEQYGWSIERYPRPPEEEGDVS